MSFVFSAIALAVPDSVGNDSRRKRAKIVRSEDASSLPGQYTKDREARRNRGCLQ